MNPEKDDTHRRNIDGSDGAVDSRGLAALTDSLSTICIDTTTTFISSIHVEVRLKKGVSKVDAEKHRSLVRDALLSLENVVNWRPVPITDEHNLSTLVENILVGCSASPEGTSLTLTDSSISDANVHFYRIAEYEAEKQEISADGDPQSASVGSQMWELPCREFDQIWESLVFDDNIKNELLSYVYALLRISDRGANSSILRVNRLILLHGPPGTGKTSLCKGLAQKLSIRLNTRYKQSTFVEINSHSLFSKWFSESGKLVQKMFDQIEELAEDNKTLVFVLIDEVESLSMARASALSRNEPGDAIRAVNALLTQIDRIRRFPNVLVLATSNISKSLDEAFVDRADMSRFVGQPSVYAVYAILSSCIREMQRIGIVETTEVIDPLSSYNEFSPNGHRLMQLSRFAVGLSGRALRQLPVLAYSKVALERLTMKQCLEALQKAIEEKKASSCI
uniref:Pachytene checkpoint protein 2 n=1 Tax=Ascaris suum TaxID=6253 RepID=F1L017_ASCSU